MEKEKVFELIVDERGLEVCAEEAGINLSDYKIDESEEVKTTIIKGTLLKDYKPGDKLDYLDE